MTVRLISVTPDAETTIAYCARVSNPANQDKPAARLIRYLIDHKHWSPFEMAHMVVEVKTSRAVSAQMLRHHSLRFQEFSQRYAAAQEVIAYPARLQDHTNRQNSLETDDAALQAWWDGAQLTHIKSALDVYHKALARGIARETARFVLPMATATTLYVAGNVRDWIFYITTRTHESTQKEHCEVAEQIKAVFMAQFPTVSAALGWKEASDGIN